jgi:hypothetical protein
VVLADGDVERLEVGVAGLDGHLDEQRRRLELLDGQGLASQRLDELLAPRLDGVLAALPREPLADLVAGAGVTAICSQSRDGPPSTLEVKISTVSPERSTESSGCSRPLTRAPMQLCPTSVCTV